MQQPYRKGSSESILASSLAGVIARWRLKGRPEAPVGGAIELRKALKRILALTVTFSNTTTEELLKRAEDLIRQNQEYLEDFISAMNQLLKRQAEFQAEHPSWGSRYS